MEASISGTSDGVWETDVLIFSILQEALFHFCFNTFFVGETISWADRQSEDDQGRHNGVTATASSSSNSSQLLGNSNTHPTSRSSVSSDRSTHSNDDFFLSEDRDDNIVLTLRKEDLDPANKDKNSKILPNDFLVRHRFE